MKLYLYGIIDSSDRIKESIYGLEGSSVCNIPYCDIGAVVSETGKPIREVTEGAVLGHELVVEKLMTDFTVLPVRFQTIIDGRDNLLLMMQSCYKDFKDNMKRLHNKLEFGIKVIWPACKVKENIIKALKEGEQRTPELDGSESKRFMREKFEKYKIEKKFEEKANGFITDMDISLGKFAAEKKIERLKTDNLLMDAGYLVEKDKENSFKEAFECMKSAHPDFKYLFSGPWPAYNFVVLSKKSGLLSRHEQADLFDELTQCQTLVGADNI